MGIRLVEEVMDWSPEDLTPNQRWGLTVLARDANDGTRETFHGPLDPEILRRIRMPLKQWEAVRSALLKRGLLEPTVGGHRGLASKYRIACMYPPCIVADHRKTPEIQGAFGGYGPAHRKGAVDRPLKSGGLQVDSPPKNEGLPADRPLKSGGPTPPSCSSEVTPPPPATSVPDQRADEGGGGGDAPQQEDEQQARASAFVDGLDYDGQIPNQHQRRRLIEAVASAIAQGWPEDKLRSQIHPGDKRVDSKLAIYLYRLKPENLPAPAVRPSKVVRQQAEWCGQCDAFDRTIETMRYDGPDGAGYVVTVRCATCHPQNVRSTAA